MTFLGPLFITLVVGLFFLCVMGVFVECGDYTRSEEAAARKDNTPKHL